MRFSSRRPRDNDTVVGDMKIASHTRVGRGSETYAGLPEEGTNENSGLEPLVHHLLGAKGTVGGAETGLNGVLTARRRAVLFLSLSSDVSSLAHPRFTLRRPEPERNNRRTGSRRCTRPLLPAACSLAGSLAPGLLESQ